MIHIDIPHDMVINVRNNIIKRQIYIKIIFNFNQLN